MSFTRRRFSRRGKVSKCEKSRPTLKLTSGEYFSLKCAHGICGIMDGLQKKIYVKKNLDVTAAVFAPLPYLLSPVSSFRSSIGTSSFHLFLLLRQLASTGILHLTICTCRTRFTKPNDVFRDMSCVEIIERLLNRMLYVIF